MCSRCFSFIYFVILPSSISKGPANSNIEVTIKNLIGMNHIFELAKDNVHFKTIKTYGIPDC